MPISLIAKTLWPVEFVWAVLLGKTGLNTHKCLEAGGGSLTVFIGNTLSWNQVAVLDNDFLCNLNLLFHIHDVKG